MELIIQEIRQELTKKIDVHTQITGHNFFKEEIRIYGVKTAQVSRIAKVYERQIKLMEKKKVFALCDALWESGYLEESFIACQWSYAMHANYTREDFKVFERWVDQHVSNWASCDTLCNHTVGTFVAMYPEFVENLKQWARSQNRWARRAAAVTLIIPARHGLFLDDIFEIADCLLLDQDDLVQKGYGWMLKAASEAHQREVFEYVLKNKDRMPRTALRYAIEKMPKELKARAIAR